MSEMNFRVTVFVLMVSLAMCLSKPTRTKDDCNIVCPAIYQPVCAEDCDGNVKQFGNWCLYQAAVECEPEKEYTIIAEGECKKPSTTTPCPTTQKTIRLRCRCWRTAKSESSESSESNESK